MVAAGVTGLGGLRAWQSGNTSIQCHYQCKLPYGKDSEAAKMKQGSGTKQPGYCYSLGRHVPDLFGHSVDLLLQLHLHLDLYVCQGCTTHNQQLSPTSVALPALLLCA